MSDVLDLPVRALFAADSSAESTRGRQHLSVGRPSADDEATGRSSALPAPPANAEQMLREAVFALAARELAGLVRALPLDRAAAALRDRDPIAAVGGLLADAALEHTATTTDDPQSVALLQGARRKRELLAQAGGAWPTGTVAEHLAITRQGVDKRRQTGTLLGVRLPSGDWVYPVAQFAPDGAPLPGLTEVLGAFRGIASPWMWLEHLLAPDPVLSAHSIGEATRAPAVSVTDDTPRSALQALREDGSTAIPAIVAALREVGDGDG